MIDQHGRARQLADLTHSLATGETQFRPDTNGETQSRPETDYGILGTAHAQRTSRELRRVLEARLKAAAWDVLFALVASSLWIVNSLCSIGYMHWRSLRPRREKSPRSQHILRRHVR